jgi:hypothetical protein
MQPAAGGTFKASWKESGRRSNNVIGGVNTGGLSRRVKYAQEGPVQTCSACKESKPLSEFHSDRSRDNGHRRKCKPCYNGHARRQNRVHPDRQRENTRRYQERHPGRQAEVYRRWWLKRYGITVHDYARLLEEQHGVCAACGQPERTPNPRNGYRLLAVDHDHETGRVRGLLCVNCNKALGHLRDDPSRIQGLLRYAQAFAARAD